jgi:hypothetical protein
MPVIPVNKMGDTKRIFGKKWRAKEEERQKGSPTDKKTCQAGAAWHRFGRFFSAWFSRTMFLFRNMRKICFTLEKMCEKSTLACDLGTRILLNK